MVMAEQAEAKAWRDAIHAERARFPLDVLKLEQMSPTFQLGPWRIAAEHQRDYRSVIIRWLGDTAPPGRPNDAVDVPPADRSKGWHFRRKLGPGELGVLLAELAALAGLDSQPQARTWLLCWSQNDPSSQEIESAIDSLRTHGFVDIRWKRHPNAGPTLGDHVYLWRQDAAFPGIFAFGVVMAFPAAHADQAADSPGDINDLAIRLTMLHDPAVDTPFDPHRETDSSLSMLELPTPTQPVAIDPGTATELEQAWARHLRELANIARLSPEQSLAPDRYREGALVRVLVNRYERDPQARSACIAHYGARCAVCDMDFESVYGDIGEGFIHVHHLQPISARAEAREVDPIRDLRPVCPNCHAMLHAKAEPYTIEELRERLEKYCQA